jgi:hypothetical protein
VFDRGFGLHLLPKNIQELFLSESIYIKGIAEQKPIAVHYTKQYTIVPASAKEPMIEPTWFQESFIISLREIKKMLLDGVNNYSFVFAKKPLDEKQVTLEIFVSYNGEARHVFLDTTSSNLEYKVKGNKCLLYLTVDWLLKDLEKFGVAEDAEITCNVCYPIISR